MTNNELILSIFMHFFFLYNIYHVLTHHTDNYHPRQTNKMYGSIGPSSKAKSILFCIINTVVTNVLLLSELSLHYFQYFFSHVIFETTVLAFY